MVSTLVEVDSTHVTMQDNDGKTALHYAAWTGYEKVVEIPVVKAHITHVTMQDNDGWTASMYYAAKKYGHEEVIEMLKFCSKS